MLTLENIFFAFQLAIASYVICVVLTQQYYILSWYDNLLAYIEQYARWIAYPLGRCEKCFAGQLALWVWLYENYDYYKNYWFSEFYFYTILKHGLFISFTIFFVLLIKLLIRKIR